METLIDALARLAAAGFRDSFRVQGGALHAIDAGRAVAPERFVVVETVRFEGDSDPQDELVLFALRSEDGSLQGTWLVSYGVLTDGESAWVMRRLGLGPRTPIRS
jgi:hypothetical protein